MRFLTLWQRLPLPFFVVTLGLSLAVVAIGLLAKGQPQVWQQEAVLSRDRELNFGYAVDIDHDTAIVGVPYSPTGNHTIRTVYIYTRTGSLWSPPLQVSSEDRAFGRAVAIDGDTLLVGADNAASISTRTLNGWSPPVQLTVPLGERAPLSFGKAVAIDGNTAVVGGVYAVCVFRHNPRSGNWVYEASLPAVDGPAVAISGDTLVVGGDRDGGGVYVFRRNTESGAWSQQARLRPSRGTYGAFGHSVAIDGETIVVGASGAWPDGAAFVFQWDAETQSWQQQARLVPQGARSPLSVFRYLTGYYFGSSVAIDGEVVVVGTGTFTQPLTPHSNQSAAFIFERNGASGRWSQQAILIPEDKPSYQMAVGVSQGSVIVGDIRGGNRINGSGLAYVFRQQEASASPANR